MVDAVRCAIEVQNGLIERNAGVPPERRIEFRVGIHLGDVVEESRRRSDGRRRQYRRAVGRHRQAGRDLSVRGRLSAGEGTGSIWQSSNSAKRNSRTSPSRCGSTRGQGRRRNAAALASVRSEQQAEPPRLSIVVLPFANIGGDSGQDYFVDGVTESLTTDLSQMSGMRVIGRNTAFSYKDKALDLKQIGRELNIRYVLEGSVQRSANRIRVNVQLIDAESGDHLWAERFDKTVADLFDMQDEIVARLANALNVQLIIAEARRAERAPSPDSMDLYFQGMSAYNSGLTPDRLSEARRLFERALALDPDNVDAIVGAARTESAFAWSHMSDDRASHLAAAEALAIKALSIAPEKAPGHVCLGIVRIYTNRVAQGIAELERALAIDRNLAEAHGYIGIAKCFLGRAEETEAHVHNALRLSPRDTFAYLWRTYLGVARVFLGKDEEAVSQLRHAIEISRNFHPAHFYLAAALAALGRLDEARAAAKEGLSIDPTFTIRRYRADAPSDNPVFLAGRQRIYEMMRKVGVPEG